MQKVNCDDPALPLAGVEDLYLAAAPDLRSLYPEYLTDPNILLCPSDAEASGKSFTNEHSGLTDIAYPCTQGDRGLWDADVSYMYLGYVLDQVDFGDPMQDLAQVGPLLGITGLTGEGPAQLVFSFIQILLPAVTGGDTRADEDLDLSDWGVGLGNGQGNTVYRMREGIERFLITDINNPAASAKAQSEVWVMSDVLATTSADYNHIPGGANVVYMDGHVEFRKYIIEGPGPVNGPMANFIGLILQ
jgi:prepilin-type processing-associated H-X9-DG protein